APRRQLVATEHDQRPEVTLRPGSPTVTDRAPRPTLGIDHQLRARAEPPPSAARHSQPVPGAKFPCELPQPIGAGLGYKQRRAYGARPLGTMSPPRLVKDHQFGTATPMPVAP